MRRPENPRKPTVALVLALLATLVAGACSDDGGTSTKADSVAAPARTVRCKAKQTDGDLELANWKNYLPAKLVRTFEKATGVDVHLHTYPSNEALHDRMTRDGGSGYDLVVPGDYMVDRLRREGRLLALTPTAITNRANLAPGFRNLPYDPKNRHSIPYQWGTSGIAVRRKSFKGAIPHSWSVLFDPAVARKNGLHISMLDDPREALGAALIFLGKSVNSTDPAAIQRASDLVAAARVAAFDSDTFAQQLRGGEVDAAQGWNGDFLVALGDKVRPTIAGSPFEYFVPKEGGLAWVDAMAVPANAKHPCTAQRFMNFLLSPRNGAALTNSNGYASPNQAAKRFVSPGILNDPAVYPPAAVVDKLEFLGNVGAASRAYEDGFAEAKRAHAPKDDAGG